MSDFGLRQWLELAGIVITLAVLAIYVFRPENELQQIKSRGYLTVVTRNSPTTYYLGPDGPAGFEYDLVRAFADHLGVKLRIVVPDSFADILPMVESGRADIAAAGITVTPERAKHVRFGPSYQNITQQVVYRVGAGRKAPKDVKDLIGKSIEVVAGSSHAARLRELKKKYPKLAWKSVDDVDSSELMYRVWQSLIDYTIADSNDVILTRRFLPALQVAFDLTKPQKLAWAFQLKSDDTSLYDAAKAFFQQLQDDGTLTQITERYYGHADNLDFVGTRVYLRHVAERLPEFENLFKQTAKKVGMDWRLLAAISYQESHWRPSAISPTGVRGLMMLTQTTAGQLGIDNRLDPRQSVMGGAEYFMHIKARIPDDIPEPDRTWMALAAYNVGLGHLEDARKITEARGGDPDKWIDVMKNLPLLASRKWYRKTRYGYARGWEPVQYVQNIRSYYDILVWYEERNKNPTNPNIEAIYNTIPPGI
ncbi:MAG: membrane-bound lytic murein transglycosylase MltF [Gammaproteobacteria bacterium]